MTSESLKWSAQLHVSPQPTFTRRLQGDKITLPQSALEGLLAAAPIVSLQNGTSRNVTTNFDPFNPYSYAAERHARDILSDRQQQLPHPLTFRLVNPLNGRVVYAGIREFSAQEGEVEMSDVLLEALGIHLKGSAQESREATPGADVEMVDAVSVLEKMPLVTIHHRAIPKGTYVKLRPLEAGYDPDDWKSLLERYLRDNFTTLTAGEVLTVAASQTEKFRFLVDKVDPEGEAICIVDTDLEVDIEAMNEEQARETLNRRLAKAKKTPGSASGSSTGGPIFLNQEIHGQVLPGEYVNYELRDWDKKGDIEVRTNTDEDVEVDIFVNPFSSLLRTEPRIDEHVFGTIGDADGRPSKRLKLNHTNVEIESAEYLSISVHAWRPDSDDTTLKDSSHPVQFTLTVSTSSRNQLENGQTEETELSSEETICKNCKQSVPKRTLHLHEAFCYRNNISCPKCSNVFLKNSDQWKQHYHCPYDNFYTSSPISHLKHDTLIHPSTTLSCPLCSFEAYNTSVLANHRTTTCPGKEVLCQFCHLLVPQQGPDDPSPTDYEVILSGMTPHEYTDGARTTDCHICNRIVRLRDMTTHLRIHDRERVGRVTPKVCSNKICGRTIRTTDESRVTNTQLGLCDTCFGPLYVTTHDPEGKQLRRRLERRLLQQIMSGCGKPWCHNAAWCRTAHKNDTGDDRTVSTREALPRIKPILVRLSQRDAVGQEHADEITELRFCVDEATQSRRVMAEMMSSEGEYELGWCVKALEESGNDLGRARGWLGERAPKIGEVLR